MRGWRDRGKSGPDRRVLATRVRARVSRSELREGLEVRRQRGQSVPLTERIESELEGDEVGIHWIEVVLVGEDDEPIPGVRYQIELPDGRVRRGVLDDRGMARVDRIKSGGMCKVTFPDLDEEAWEAK